MKTPLRFLLITLDGGGNIPPILGLVKKYMARGHEVHLLSEPCLQPMAEKIGLPFTPFTDYFTRQNRSEDLFRDWKKGLTKDPALENVVFGPSETLVKQTLAAIDKINPDILLIDVLFLPAQIAAEVKNIPSVLLFHMPEYLPGQNRPPGMLGLLPGKGWFGRSRDKFLSKVFQKVFDQYLPLLNSIRQKHQLPPLNHVEDLLHQVNLRLIQTSKSFDFPLEPAPANVRYTGPVLDDPDWVESWENPWEVSDTRPLVVVSLSSTFQNQGATLQSCIDALSSLPVRGLVTTGPAIDPASFRHGNNVVVVATAPHSRVFPLASLVVTHAGHGTIMRALSFGKPLLCLPVGRDQKDNAAKVVFHGVGRQLPKNASAKAMAAHIRDLLSIPTFSEQAKKWSQILQADSQQEDWVQEVESLANPVRQLRENLVLH